MILGFDGTEIETIAKYNTFCNLCYKEIFQDESALTWPGRKFLIHIDCKDINVIVRKTITQFKKTKNRTSVKEGTVRGRFNKPNQSRKNWN